MKLFVENVNKYLKYKKIKQSYVSLMTGIDVHKLSRLLMGDQDITCSDMEKISAALGKQTDYFLKMDGLDCTITNNSQIAAREIHIYY